VIEAWASWPDEAIAPLEDTAEIAHRSWSKGEPLLAVAQPQIDRERVEPLLAAALDVIAELEKGAVPLFVDGWNRGDIGPTSLFPAQGRIGAIDLQNRCQLTQEALAFLAIAGLRPALSAYFARCRDVVDAGLWDQGLCPCCGGPPGFADLLEDGRRQLACHLCDTRWIFARLICPLCGNRATDDFVRLIAEDADEGYAIAACRACRGYIKEIDRRARWNAGPAIVEDWGSPHLDLIAHRQEYWRPLPTLIQLTENGAHLPRHRSR
jgi:hypothetical protein